MMERSIGIINMEIQKRESMLMNPKYVLRVNEIKAELSSLKKAVDLVKKSSDIHNVTHCDCENSKAIETAKGMICYECEKPK